MRGEALAPKARWDHPYGLLERIGRRLVFFGFEMVGNFERDGLEADAS
jgi:hypothetical protein